MLLDFEKLATKDHKAQNMERVALEVLGKTYVQFKTERLLLDEDFEKANAVVKANLVETIGEQTKALEIEGQGVGLIDAFFDAITNAFAREYSSLSSISIVDFHINIKFKNSMGRKSDALAVATLTVKNLENHDFVFNYASSSISQTSIAVVLEAMRFFINCERAYIQLYIALEDAKKRSRFDLIERYQNQMSTLVQATSYRQIVERMNKSHSQSSHKK